MFTALGMALWTEYSASVDDLRSSPLVVGLHVASVVALVMWSAITMRSVEALVPATRYQRKSSGRFIVLLWIVAFAAPVGAVLAYRSQARSIDDHASQTSLAIMVGVVLLAFVLVWLPFRYHSRQAARIGAPHRVITMWFWVPLFAAVGGIAIVALGLGDQLADGGWTAFDRFVQVGVVYGLPMFLFALTTWRSVTVFDEVLDLRWRRWKTEWEQTLEDFVAQPEPGPEISPEVEMN
jgi:hypothetical protein